MLRNKMAFKRLRNVIVLGLILTIMLGIYNNTIKNVKNGDIILMHEIYKNSYEAFCKAVDTLYKDGYRFVTVTELIGKSNIKAGKKYTHG